MKASTVFMAVKHILEVCRIADSPFSLNRQIGIPYFSALAKISESLSEDEARDLTNMAQAGWVTITLLQTEKPIAYIATWSGGPAFYLYC